MVDHGMVDDGTIDHGMVDDGMIDDDLYDRKTLGLPSLDARQMSAVWVCHDRI